MIMVEVVILEGGLWCYFRQACTLDHKKREEYAIPWPSHLETFSVLVQNKRELHLSASRQMAEEKATVKSLSRVTEVVPPVHLVSWDTEH